MSKFPSTAPIFRVAPNPTHNTLLRPGEEVEFVGFSSVRAAPFRVSPHPYGQRGDIAPGCYTNYTTAAPSDLEPLTEAARALIKYPAIEADVRNNEILLLGLNPEEV